MGYYVKRFWTLILTLFLVSVFTFISFNIIPGDPALMILGTEASPEKIAILHAQLGLDKSLLTQYVEWLTGMFRGDFGTSIQFSLPVKSLIAERLPVTISLAVFSLVLIIAASIPIGVYTAKKRGTLIDKLIGIITMMSISLPSFFIGIIFILLFGIILNLFVPGGYISYQKDFFGFSKYMFFPAVTIALPNIAIVVKFLRMSIINEMNLDYVRTAYSKGNKDNAVLYCHVLRNSIIPVITLLGMVVADVFSGSIITEQVFNLPGIGRLLVSSIMSRDFPLIEALVIYIAFLVVIANLLADVLLYIIDPRIRRS